MANIPLTIKSFSNFITDDFYRTYLFDVTVLTSGTPFQTQWVASTQTPVATTTIQTIDMFHTQSKQPGRTTVQQWSVTLRDDSGNRAFDYFNKWKLSAYNPRSNDAKTVPSRCKRDVRVVMHSPTHSNAESEKIFDLYGVWPIEIGQIALDYNSADIVTFPVTLSVDFFEPFMKVIGLVSVVTSNERGG